MIRIAVQELALFLLPFLVFGLGLALRRRNVLHLEAWSGAGLSLAIVGLVLAIGSFVIAGLFGERHTGGYVAPHMENGRPVPGRFE